MFSSFIRKWKEKLMRRVFGSIYRPGHFYSVIPNKSDYEFQLPTLVDKSSPILPGIDLNLKGQIEFLEKAKPFFMDMPFSKMPSSELNYYFNNLYYTEPDAVALYLILRSFQPKHIIEVGSGFSSAILMDVNKLFFGNKMKCTFIEPFPDRLNWFLSKSPNSNYKLLEQKVQQIPMENFDQLEANDLLLIDSSHVSKLGSDVNYLFFNVLPRLKKGVLVHIHDVIYPFEYPIAWIKELRNWNEAYLLKSFLIHNESYEIVLFNSYLTVHHKAWLQENLPSLGFSEGGSIFIRKIK